MAYTLVYVIFLLYLCSRKGFFEYEYEFWICTSSGSGANDEGGRLQV